MRGTFHENANDNPFFVICKVGAFTVVLILFVRPSAILAPPRVLSFLVLVNWCLPLPPLRGVSSLCSP